MLDERSKIVLNYLVNECSEGAYRVIDTAELINALPKKFKPDDATVSLCMDYLEKGNYISIKYKDAKMYCVSPLPFARQILENESNEREKTKKMYKIGSLLYILVFACAFLGSFLAIIIYGLIF
ncbi:MAG: hypothetical protein SOV27_00055 [Eubacteriales bacterium]|nr:hypothetical protein [Eubacteriales bacterium]